MFWFLQNLKKHFFVTWVYFNKYLHNTFRMQQQCGDANPYEAVYLKSKIRRQLSHSLCKHTSQTLISFSNLFAFHIHEFTIDASSLHVIKRKSKTKKGKQFPKKKSFLYLNHLLTFMEVMLFRSYHPNHSIDIASSNLHAQFFKLF